MKKVLLAVICAFALFLFNPSHVAAQQWGQKLVITEADPPQKVIDAYEAWRLTELGIFIENLTQSNDPDQLKPVFLGYYKVNRLGTQPYGNGETYYAVYWHSNGYVSAVTITSNGVDVGYIPWSIFLLYSDFVSSQKK